MSIDTEVIRAEPHREVGSVIQRDAALLVERWCRRAVQEQPNATRVYYETLRNQLPDFIRAMGRSLMRTGDSEAGERRDSAVEHGEQRWDSGWSLPELVQDYQILRLVILEYLEETLERPLRYREVMAVGVFIDDAVGASVAAFAASRDEHLRRIQQERAEALEEATRRKDEFIAMLAHELRNPLAPIQNALKIVQLLLPAAEPAVSEALGILERQTTQLVRLVDDLLDLARIAQGRFELRKNHINLASVLEQAVQTSEPMLKARGHQLTVRLPEQPVYLEADPARLVQVVGNLLNNAAKYTDRGGQIQLTVERDGSEVVISVIDNGIGIPPEMVSRVFDMFTQLDGSQDRSQGGLGIGLTLVKRLVALHGGSVACQSKGVGAGSEFVIRLPACAGSAQARSADARSADARSADARSADPLHESKGAAPCHVLIIEDQADARDSLAALMRMLGHRVDVAENGNRGAEKALTVRPQVALIDIGLPDVNGYEVAKKLRSALADGIFLIALTGYGQSDDLRAALDAGFDAHLTKPAHLGELNRLLAKVAQRRVSLD